MAITMESIKRGVSSAPPRILIYGVHGIGKTTMVSQAPNPILLQAGEDGEGIIDIPRFPKIADTFDYVMECLQFLAEEDHGFNTVGIDSIDWLERLVWAKVVEDNPMAGSVKSPRVVAKIEDYDFQKGYKMAMDYWREYIEGINYLRTERNMMVIQIAHAAIQTFDSPETGAYDRYSISLHTNKKGEGASALLLQHSDIVLFANYLIGTTEEKVGINSTKKRAVGSGQRFLFTEERPAYTAKNRYNLPEKIKFDKDGSYWGVLAAHIPFLQTDFDIQASDQSLHADSGYAEEQQTEEVQPTKEGE